MNPILKLVQQVKDAEGVTLASVIKKVEDIRVGENENKDTIKRVATALITLKKEVDAIPLTAEVKKLQQAIKDAEKRVDDALNADIKAVKVDLRNTEDRLRQEIEDKIPDIVTITEKVTEVAKELDESEIAKVLKRASEDEFVKKIRDIIEGWEGEDRLDATKLKNLPQLQVLNAGGGSNLSVFKDGNLVNSSTRLNFTGSGVTSVTNTGGTTTVTISGGAGGGYTNLTEFVDQTAWRVFYSNGSGDVTELALGADGTFLKSNGATSAPSFSTPAGSGDVSKVGTPVNNQVGVWTGDGTIEGDANLTFDTTDDTLTVGGKVVTPIVRAASSAGIIIQANGGTQVVDFGAGGGSNVTFAGGVNIDGQTRLATSLTGPLRADSGVVSVDTTRITRSVIVTSGSVTAGSATATDYVYLIAGAHTISLPAASGNTNRYTFKNNHSANVTVDTSGSETIDGAASISLAPEEAVDIISNGTNFNII